MLCPVGWIPNHHSGSCFKLNTKDLSYADNRRSCQIQGGDLAMILEANTNAFLTRMVIARSEVNSSFVGLNDLQVEGTFRWLDFKDPVNYTAWDADQPDNRNQNEHCLVLANYYLTDRQKWIDYVCQAPLLGICEKYADCLMETYGAFCPVDCSKTRCRGVCNPRTGSCLECRPGYQGLFCEKSCPHNRYGDNCGENCSLNCAGTQGCDTVTGKCLGGCKGEFAGDKCDREKCPINNWGLNCALKCSENCAGAEGCDDISGDCVSGCKSGFQGGNCTQGNCPKNTYGEDCSNTCSEGCAGTQGCDSISGSCLDGCKAGLEGDKCKKGLGSNNTIQDASGRKVAGMTPNKTTEGESATKGNNSLWFLFFLIPFLLLIIILMILLKKKQRKRKDQGLEEEFDAHLPAVEEEAERPPPEVAAEEVGEGAAPVVAEESVENQNLSPEPAPVKKLSNV